MYGCVLSEIDGTEMEYRPEGAAGIPEEFSYVHQLPPVLDQGEHPLCVPSSISAYVNWKMNAEEARNVLRDIDSWGMYGSKEIEGEGMTFKEAFRYLIDDGLEVSGYGEPFKVKKYARIGSTFILKPAIVSNGPVMCVLPVTDGTKDDFWSAKYGKLVGLHAVALVGYGRDGFIIRNSWGTSYGKDGYSFLPQEETGRIKELWTILE